MNIVIDSVAATKIHKLLSELEEPCLGMRLGVQGGGCSGFQYIIAPCFETDDLDTVIKQGELFVFVDAFSLQYLDGATINYEDSALGQNITITNPNATGTCGCGHSFYQ